jgi:hypothetical protein
VRLGVPAQEHGQWRGLSLGLIVLVVVSVVYPLLADLTARPLAAFALPTLLTAVISGWRPTAVIGVLSLSMASLIGALGSLSGAALGARLTVILLACAAGVVGAWFREQQEAQMLELAESNLLLRTLERAMVPATEPGSEFEVATRYVAAERHLHIGGDFLDAVRLADGSLAVIVGDVCGHGPDEAALGVAFRSAWRAIVLTHPADPVEWIEQLNQMFVGTPAARGDSYVTVCTGMVDHRNCEVTLVSAGHPWPILVGADAQIAKMTSGAPIGLGPAVWTATTIDVDDHTLVLYTDGLIENPLPDGRQRWGEHGLVEWLADQPADIACRLLADRLIHEATIGRDLRDDAAVMAVRCRSGSTEPTAST